MLKHAEFFREAEELTRKAVHSQFKDIPDVFNQPMDIGRGELGKILSLAMTLNSEAGLVALLVYRNWSKLQDGNNTILCISQLGENDKKLLAAGETQVAISKVLYRASFGNSPEDFRITWTQDKTSPQLLPTLEHLEARGRLVEICMDSVSKGNIDQVIRSSVVSDAFRGNVGSEATEQFAFIK